MFIKKMIVEQQNGKITSLTSPIYRTRFIPNEFGEVFLISNLPVSKAGTSGIYCANSEKLVEIYEGDVFNVYPVPGSVTEIAEKGIRTECVKVDIPKENVIYIKDKPGIRGYRDVFFRLHGEYAVQGDKILGILFDRHYYFPENKKLTGFLRGYDLTNKNGQEFLVYMPFCAIENGKLLYGRFIVLEDIDFYIPSFDELKLYEIPYLIDMDQDRLGDYLNEFFDIKIIRNGKRNLAVIVNNSIAFASNHFDVQRIDFRKKKRNDAAKFSVNFEDIYSIEKINKGLFMIRAGKVEISTDETILRLDEWTEDDIATFIEETKFNVYLLDDGKTPWISKFPEDIISRLRATAYIIFNFPNWREQTIFEIRECVVAVIEDGTPAKTVGDLFKKIRIRLEGGC